MKKYIVFTLILFHGAGTFGQLNMSSPRYKILSLIISSIDNFKKDPVFQHYMDHEKKNIYYALKDVSINYITLRRKFGIDTNRKYTAELKDFIPGNEFNIYNIKDSARLHIARGDLIISVFQPSYFNGYTYVLAYARNDCSTYGGRISNFLFILDSRMKVVKYYYLKGVI